MRLSRWVWGCLGGCLSVVVIVAVVATVVAFAMTRTPQRTPNQFHPAPNQQLQVDRPLVFTYYFYWYDPATHSHLGPGTPLPTHPVAEPTPSWKNVAWHRKELADMTEAGIDVAMPVYWGFDRGEEWSTGGLAPMVQAREQLLAAGAHPPALGLFLDTSIFKGRDLTKDAEMDYFYANVKDFYTRIPRSHWALVNGRPPVWIWGPQEGNRAGQTLFDRVYDRFTADFGVRPFIVRDLGWDCTITDWRNHQPVQDCSRQVHTDASYVWGAAYRGYDPHGEVAAVGPGYDDRSVPGRVGTYTPRDDGHFYTANFEKAIASRKPILAVETWNEFHEASGVGESVEFGRRYLELTKALVARYKTALKTP